MSERSETDCLLQENQVPHRSGGAKKHGAFSETRSTGLFSIPAGLLRLYSLQKHRGAWHVFDNMTAWEKIATIVNAAPPRSWKLDGKMQIGSVSGRVKWG